MGYCPHTPADIRLMLEAVGVASLEELFADIPPELRSGPLDLPAALSEFEVLERLRGLASANPPEPVSFLGGGAYDHYVPAAVDALSGRAEFYTAYTPYQPECSQGTLQALYEYQTAICRLTGLDVANASLYDGGTALAEALLMALRATRRSRVVLDGALPPAYLEIVRTYLGARSCETEIVPPLGCSSAAAALASRLDGSTAAVAVASPNFFGSVADFGAVTETARSLGVLSITSCRPLALGL
ncbi:MAG TPA: glycine dehydrogenase, partial [bacterium]|nr:glycine dehydrogenase [bacterium]